MMMVVMMMLMMVMHINFEFPRYCYPRATETLTKLRSLQSFKCKQSLWLWLCSQWPYHIQGRQKYPDIHGHHYRLQKFSSPILFLVQKYLPAAATFNFFASSKKHSFVSRPNNVKLFAFCRSFQLCSIVLSGCLIAMIQEIF